MSLIMRYEQAKATKPPTTVEGETMVGVDGEGAGGMR